MKRMMQCSHHAPQITLFGEERCLTCTENEAILAQIRRGELACPACGAVHGLMWWDENLRLHDINTPPAGDYVILCLSCGSYGVIADGSLIWGETHD